MRLTPPVPSMPALSTSAVSTRSLRTLALSALLACVAAPMSGALAASPPAKARTTQEILDASAPSDWRTLDPARTLYLELASGRVIIELAPAFAPAHVGNITTLAREGYWNGLAVIRSQDNFVVQWGDPHADDAAKKKPMGSAKAKLPAEFERASKGLAFRALPDTDGWAPQAGFVDGFPVGHDAKAGRTWLAHCYGAVGAGRNNEEDSSTGAELYVVTGQSPRQLDRNITVVGRVVQGMELLSVLPRGTGPLGFYEKPEQYAGIRAIRLAQDVPATERTPLQVLRTDTLLFDELVEARRNRRDAFYKRPAGHINVCNVPLPTRVPPAG